MPRKLTQQEILTRFKHAHGDRYVYDQVRYTSYHKPVRIVCTVHGPFDQLPSNHEKGHGCYDCAATQRGIDRVESEWTEQEVSLLKEIHKSHSLVACGKAIGKDSRTVKVKLKRLGLSPKSTRNPMFSIIPGYLWTHLLHSARIRGIEVCIKVKDIEDVFLRQDRRCALTGWPLSFSTKPTQTTASVDRIDSLKGYTRSNIQIVHKKVNRAKMDHTETDLYQICKAITEYRKDLDIKQA